MTEEKVATYWSSYIKVKCPYCERMNYVDLGNVQDLSGVDPEAMECWSCDKKSWLAENTKEDYGYDSVEDADMVHGRREIK